MFLTIYSFIVGIVIRTIYNGHNLCKTSHSSHGFSTEKLQRPHFTGKINALNYCSWCVRHQAQNNPLTASALLYKGSLPWPRVRHMEPLTHSSVCSYSLGYQADFRFHLKWSSCPTPWLSAHPYLWIWTSAALWLRLCIVLKLSSPSGHYPSHPMVAIQLSLSNLSGTSASMVGTAYLTCRYFDLFSVLIRI